MPTEMIEIRGPRPYSPLEGWGRGAGRPAGGWCRPRWPILLPASARGPLGVYPLRTTGVVSERERERRQVFALSRCEHHENVVAYNNAWAEVSIHIMAHTNTLSLSLSPFLFFSLSLSPSLYRSIPVHQPFNTLWVSVHPPSHECARTRARTRADIQQHACERKRER